MRASSEGCEGAVLDTAGRLSSLSIVIDDFDLDDRAPAGPREARAPPARPYARQASDASIKKILEEAEHRKHEFWKLIDEHNAVIQNLKRIEQLEPPSPIRT